MNSLEAQLAAAFALSLLGGMHCAAMCGGFVGALQTRRPPQLGALPFAGAYHGGRVLAYVAAGGLAGLIGGGLFAARVLPLQIGLLVLASAVLAGVGLSLLGASGWTRWLERAGGRFWRLVQPWARRVLPPRSLGAAALAGFVWGWIPCGMVYAALPVALISGSAVHGTLVMLAFGIGTLPNMLALELGTRAIAPLPARQGAPAHGAWRRLREGLRPAVGLGILLFAASDLAHAVHLAGSQSAGLVLLESICHSAH
jgi:sulfite exporter TauE/SafE